jgi:S-adenosylmethionine-dependent methyltransferase
MPNQFVAIDKHRIPKQLVDRFTKLTPSAEQQVIGALKAHYFPRQIWGQVALSTDEWLKTDEGIQDLRDHTTRRLHVFRTKVVPWLDAGKPLQGANILEIGCGTGASTVALAEQGARVTAVDIDDESLLVAQERMNAHGLECEFIKANGAQIWEQLRDRRFDYVIFFACLEHMTYAERLRAMRLSWEQLRPGDLWCSIETPNRLWFYDDHTSRLNFFNWLPDELAFDYSKFSAREPFRSAYRDKTLDAFESFLRHGRGVSFHEFDLTMGSAADLDIVSCLHLRLRKPGLLGWRELKRMRKPKAQFERLIARLRPDLHRGFFLPYLDLIIRKSS